MSKALDDLTQGAREKHFPRGQIILYEGDMPQEVFIIKAGVIKLYDIDEHGNEKILHLVKSPTLIPFAFFSGLSQPLTWFYTALTDCDVWVLSADRVKEAMQHNPELLDMLIHKFSADVHELLVHLSSLGKTNTRGKLLAALKFLQVCHASQRPSGWWRVNFSVNHQLLADLAGITRESAAMVMKDMQTKKIVRHPRLTILEINREQLISVSV